MIKQKCPKISMVLVICICLSLMNAPFSSAIVFNDEETINDPYNQLFDGEPYWQLYNWTELISENNPNPYSPPPEYNPHTTVIDTTDFIRVSESRTEFVDGYGAPFVIKAMGINMPSCVSGTPYSTLCYHHNKSSYAQLSAMGFNTVRFLLNMDWFYPQSVEPGMEDVLNWNVMEYRYKSLADKAECQAKGKLPETKINWYCVGLDWIRRNIEWAKEYNMKVILDMHIINGIQDNGVNSNSIVFHNTAEGKEKRRQLIKTWETIANMVYNDSTVLGYGILNEPIIPLVSDDSGHHLGGDIISGTGENEAVAEEKVDAVEAIHNTISQWPALIEEIKFAIRGNAANTIKPKDPYHILFVQPMQDIEDEYHQKLSNKYNANYILNSQKYNFRIGDDNAAVEVHFYEPYYYSHISRNPMEYDDPNNSADVYVELDRGEYKTKGLVNFSYPNEDVCLKTENAEIDPFFVRTVSSNILSEKYTFTNSKGITISSSHPDYRSYFVMGNSITGTQMRRGKTQNGYKHFVSSRYQFNPDHSQDNMGMVILSAENLGSNAKVYFDNIVVKEYLSSTSTDAKILLSTSLDWSLDIFPYANDVDAAYYDKDNDIGCVPVSKSIDRFVDENTPGYNNGAFVLQKETGNVTAEPDLFHFIPEKGKYYTIECDVKYTGTNTNAVIQPELRFFECDKAYGFNKDFLASCFKDYQEKVGTRWVVDKKNGWTGELEVNPVFVGEFGVGNVNYIDNKDDLGGERWAKDMMELFVEFSDGKETSESEDRIPVNFCYFFYNYYDFGLYSCKNGEEIQPQMYNKKLGDLFVKYLRRINNNVVMKSESTKAVANGCVSNNSYNFINSSGTTIAPLRYICESLGDSVYWDKISNQTVVTNSITGEYLTFRLNHTTVRKYNAKGKLLAIAELPSAPMQLSDNKTTFVPLRAFMEILGYQVNFKTFSNADCENSNQYGQYICISTRKNAFSNGMAEALIQQYNGLNAG